jgi:hypothetical protein
MSSPTDPPPLLSLRTAVVLFFAAATGSVAGVLTYIESGPTTAVLVAGPAFAVSALWFHKVIES